MVSSLAVKERALELGFDLAGIATIGVWKDLEFSREWVEKGLNGEMRYLENPKRFDPHLVLPSAKSVICVGLVYNAPLAYSTELGVGSQEPGVRSQNATASDRQRTTDNGQMASSSGEFRISSFGCRAARLGFALRLGAGLPRDNAGKARTASRGFGSAGARRRDPGLR